MWAGVWPGWVRAEELGSICTGIYLYAYVLMCIDVEETDMSQYDEYSTPSQAEGERLDEDMDEKEKMQRHHPQTTRTTPSQAEGERSTDDEGK